MKTDRNFGVVMILCALAYIASSYNLPPGSMFDKLGPKAFPIIVAVGAILSATTMILRPDAEPDWPAIPTLLALAFASAVLVAYAYALKPFGFLVPTAIAAGVLSYQISPNARHAPIVGICLSVGLFIVFKYALGLNLLAFPRALMG